LELGGVAGLPCVFSSDYILWITTMAPFKAAAAVEKRLAA